MLQRSFRGRMARAAAQLEAMQALFAPPPKVSFTARGELPTAIVLSHGGADAVNDWEVGFRVQGAASAKPLDHLVARAVFEVSAGAADARLVFRTLRGA
eukprot:3418783-Prymnesium_polylepis.1